MGYRQVSREWDKVCKQKKFRLLSLHIKYILWTEIKQQNEGSSYFNGKFAKFSKTIQTFMKNQSQISIHSVNGNFRYANEMADEYTE